MAQGGWVGLDDVSSWNSLLHQTCDTGDNRLLVVRIAAGPSNFLFYYLVIRCLTLTLRFELLLDLRKSLLNWWHHIGLTAQRSIHFVFHYLQIRYSFYSEIHSLRITVVSRLWNDIIKAKFCRRFFPIYFVGNAGKGPWHALVFYLVNKRGDIYVSFTLMFDMKNSTINLALLCLEKWWI